MANIFKEYKARKLEKTEREQKQKELKIRINIKKTLSSMKGQAAKLEQFKKDYIEKARQAQLISNENSYKLAKKGLKLCLAKQRFIEQMISNFEIALQMNEMNKVVGQFIEGMNVISEEMKGITSSIDVIKAQESYQQALANNQGQYEALDAFLQEASASLDTITEDDSDVTDDELDKLINNEAVSSETKLDDEIDSKIEKIKSEMNVTY